MDLHWLTLHQAAQWITQGELSSEALTQALLERIYHLDAKLNAFITLTPELALEQARRADEEIRRGVRRGALHGIPMALKDLYETAGIRTTCGSKRFGEYTPQADARVVSALRQAGGVLLGKLNMHEIALGLTNENPHYGVCHNPWDRQRVSGGSSGGSAAALAAGLCLASMGSDTGGSIRVPAAFCGVVGLKPTYGRISLSGVMPLSWHLDHPAPMARCVRDTALLLQVVAGYDPDDPYSGDIPVPDYLADLEEGVRGWRVALATGDYFQDVETGIWSLIEAAARVFADLGAQVEPVDIPGFEEAGRANSRLVPADAAVLYQAHLEENLENFGEDVRERLRTGAATSLADYVQARRVQAAFRRQMEIFFSKYDLLLLPTTPMVAPPVELTQTVQRARLLTRFTSAFNLAGLPAISLPCGFIEVADRQLPVGLQIVAAHWAEATLLRGAYAYEQAVGWHTLHPEVD